MQATYACTLGDDFVKPEGLELATYFGPGAHFVLATSPQ